MDSVNREGCLPYDKPFPGPPTLTECMLDFGQVFRGTQKTLQQIIANTTKQPMIWLADAGESKWLIMEPDHGILQPGERQSIRVTADTSTLAVGEHSVTLTFSSEGDETSMSKNTTSKVKVEESPVQPESLTPLSLTPGPHLGWLTPQSTNTIGLVINNPDTRSIDWEIQVGSGPSGMGNRVHFAHLENPANHREDFAIAQNNGIILSQSTGSLHPGESVTMYVTANAAALEPDYSYTTNLTLTSKVSQPPEATSTSVQVPVTFYVSAHPYNDGGPKVPYGLPSHIAVTIPPQQPQTTYTLSFTNNSNNNTVYWTLNAPPDPPLPAWLVPNLLSGTLKANDSASIVLTAQRGGLVIGSYKAQLYLTFSWVDQNGLPAGSQTAAPPILVYLAVN
jgi:hypothetical protein